MKPATHYGSLVSLFTAIVVASFVTHVAATSEHCPQADLNTCFTAVVDTDPTVARDLEGCEACLLEISENPTGIFMNGNEEINETFTCDMVQKPFCKVLNGCNCRECDAEIR